VSVSGVIVNVNDLPFGDTPRERRTFAMCLGNDMAVVFMSGTINFYLDLYLILTTWGH